MEIEYKILLAFFGGLGIGVIIGVLQGINISKIKKEKILNYEK